MSVGNLPPGATVLIKITYVAELAVEGENIVFSLPGSVAPWKKEAALDETTQTDVEKVKVKEQRYVHVCVCVEFYVGTYTINVAVMYIMQCWRCSVICLLLYHVRVCHCYSEHGNYVH